MAAMVQQLVVTWSSFEQLYVIKRVDNSADFYVGEKLSRDRFSRLNSQGWKLCVEEE